MTRDQDPLNRLMPPPRRDIPPNAVERMRASITGSFAQSHARTGLLGSRLWRSTTRKIVVALVPVALVGAGWAYASSQNATVEGTPGFVTCFGAPSLDAPAAGFPPRPSVSVQELCDSAWARGAITAPPVGSAPASWMTCLSDEGNVLAFPTRDSRICDELGLQGVVVQPNNLPHSRSPSGRPSA
jgi:hypothetical protein